MAYFLLSGYPSNGNFYSMKFHPSSLCASLSMALLTFSCSPEKEALPEMAVSPFYEYENSISADALSLIIDDIVEAAILSEEYKGEPAETFPIVFFEGATVSGRSEGSYMVKDVDFGQGVELGNGVVVSGKLWCTYIRYQGSPQRVEMQVGFENFHLNDMLIGGRKWIQRTWNTAGVENAPQITIETELGVYPDGDVEGRKIGIKGTSTRVWGQGYGTRDWKDNTVLIGGERSLTVKDGDQVLAAYDLEIRRPLLHFWGCAHAVSGEIGVVTEKSSGTLDYGTGVCDNKASFSVPGEELKVLMLK